MRKPSQERRMRQPRLSSELHETLKMVAVVLKKEGCSSAEVRAALLSICGVPVEGANLRDFRIFG